MMGFADAVCVQVWSQELVPLPGVRAYFIIIPRARVWKVAKGERESLTELVSSIVRPVCMSELVESHFNVWSSTVSYSAPMLTKWKPFIKKRKKKKTGWGGGGW